MTIKKFAVKTLLLLAAVAISMVGLARLFPPAINVIEADYLSASVDKHHLLAGAASPKIILAGGSGIALGVDSAKIQTGLGKPVVNMGLYAGLGIRAMLDELRPYIHEGDIIYIAPEYQLYYREADGEIANRLSCFYNACARAYFYLERRAKISWQFHHAGQTRAASRAGGIF
jgi:hypothetical protein